MLISHGQVMSSTKECVVWVVPPHIFKQGGIRSIRGIRILVILLQILLVGVVELLGYFHTTYQGSLVNST